MKLKFGTYGPLAAGILAALGASACCVGPLALVMLGVSGSWAASLKVMEPLRPGFLLLSLVFFGVAFRRLYSRAQTCEAGRLCAKPETRRAQRAIFWSAGILVLALLAFPRYAALFY